MSRIVVLGGGGFIGANLARRLAAEGHDVIAVDIAFQAWRQPTDAVMLQVDLRNPERARMAVHGADLVFNLAADMGGVGWFHSDKDFGSSMMNGIITNNVLSACVELDVPRLVYASSVCACATEADRPLTEADLDWGTPDARYGAEKRYGAWMHRSAPMDARVAVLDTVYGPLQEHEGQRMKFPAAVATKALAARQTGRLELWGNGEQLRCYLYVDDAVDRLMTLAFAPENPGPVIIGGSGPISCRQVAELCLGIVGATDAEVVTVDGPTGVQERDTDLTKWVDHFGTPTQIGYAEGFARFIEWLETL